MIISRTPLRISFVGGGTDMDYFYKKHNGAVISAAIDKYIYLIVKKRYDKKIVLNYRKRESVHSINEIQHELIKSALELLNINNSVEIQSIADIPSEGSGLGSSSAFTVGVLNALTNYINEPLHNMKLAELACKIEIDILGAPIGKQDQYGCAIGGLKLIDFNSDDSVDVSIIPNKNNLYLELENKLILVNTNKTRSASKMLSNQKENFNNNENSLIQIRDSVPRFYNYLINSDFQLINKSIRDYWETKKSIMSNNDSIALYDSYVPEFCDSGKICGAGGGGYFLFLKKNHSNLEGKDYLNLNIDIKGTSIIYNNYI